LLNECLIVLSYSRDDVQGRLRVCKQGLRTVHGSRD